MATTRLISCHMGTGKTILASIKSSIDYGKNSEKTRDGELISSYECSPETADYEFFLSKKQYNFITGRTQDKKHDVLLYQIRQSFEPGTITPEKANQIGYELAMRFTKGKHAFIVTTHEDKAHIHSHIYFNSTALDCTKKFKNFWGAAFAVRRLSDQICIENGLSIIKNPKKNRKHYGSWLGDKKKLSNRDILKQDIDNILAKNPKDFEDFLCLMKDIGYTIKQGKNLTFSHSKFNRSIRCNSLKGNYTEEILKERIEKKIDEKQEELLDDNVNIEPVKINLIIDIQNSIKAKNSPGYERWAKVFNLKQAAQTLIYLQENNIDEYDKLTKSISQKNSMQSNLSEKIKVIEKRLNEIKDLEKHIGNYGKTKEIYMQYRKSGYDKDFLENFEEKIILHESAKKAFNALGVKKLPSIKALKTEYAELKSEKNELYNEYKKVKDEIKKLTIIKANTDRLLAYPKEEKRHQKKDFNR